MKNNSMVPAAVPTMVAAMPSFPQHLCLDLAKRRH